MKLVGSGYIQRLFAASDEQTILRKPNIRRFAKENGVTYQIVNSVWLIDIDGFLKAIAPKVYPNNLTMPRLRCIQTAVTEYNRAHKVKIDKHVVEKCMRSEDVFKHCHGNRWIINYDELEPVTDRFLAEKLV